MKLPHGLLSLLSQSLLNSHLLSETFPNHPIELANTCFLSHLPDLPSCFLSLHCTYQNLNYGRKILQNISQLIFSQWNTSWVLFFCLFYFPFLLFVFVFVINLGFCFIVFFSFLIFFLIFGILCGLWGLSPPRQGLGLGPWVESAVSRMLDHQGIPSPREY